jgi:dUTP pyrophosphatase
MQQFNIEVVPGGVMPSKVHSTDADYDIYARLDQSVIIPPGERALIPAGFKAEIPPGWRFKLETRSGKGWKEGYLIGAGVIDAGYENEIGVLVHNMNPQIEVFENFRYRDIGFDESIHERFDDFRPAKSGFIVINPGDKIAQFAIERVWDTELVQVQSIKKGSERAENGFGSSDCVK